MYNDLFKEIQTGAKGFPPILTVYICWKCVYILIYMLSTISRSQLTCSKESMAIYMQDRTYKQQRQFANEEWGGGDESTNNQGQ